MNPRILKDGILYRLLEEADKDLADQVRAGGCPCGGALHTADYPRKPRGGPDGLRWNKRYSFCCERDGCRGRRTPPSVRFLGRKVYLGVVVVLIAAMMHGVDRRRLARLQEELEIDKRTLERWREWWLDEFVSTSFWRAASARLMPPVDESILPLSLVERFDGTRREGLVKLMKFLTPITVGWEGLAMGI